MSWPSRNPDQPPSVGALAGWILARGIGEPGAMSLYLGDGLANRPSVSARLAARRCRRAGTRCARDGPDRSRSLNARTSALGRTRRFAGRRGRPFAATAARRQSVTEVENGRLDWGLPKDHERRQGSDTEVPRGRAGRALAGKAPDDPRVHHEVRRDAAGRIGAEVLVRPGSEGVGSPGRPDAARATPQGRVIGCVGTCQRQGGATDARAR